MFTGSIKRPQIVELLKALQATIGKKLLIIWDRLQAHRSKLVRAHVEAQRGQIMIDHLPAYAPDMNRVECICHLFMQDSISGTQMITAVLGLSLHGWAVDRLYRAGIRDAHMRYFVGMRPLAGIFAVCAYVSSTPWTTIVLFNASYFFLTGYPSVGAASLQISTPPFLRGTSAVYLIGLKLVGAALEPFVVAAITDYGFRSNAMIGNLMSIFAACTTTIGTATFVLGSKYMRRVFAGRGLRPSPIGSWSPRNQYEARIFDFVIHLFANDQHLQCTASLYAHNVLQNERV